MANGSLVSASVSALAAMPLPPYPTGPYSKLLLTSQMLLYAAAQLGFDASVVDYKKSVLAIGRGNNRLIIDGPMMPLNTLAADYVCTRKWLADELLRKMGAPVPETHVTTSLQQAQKAARILGWPVAVKPGIGTMGDGVTADIKSDVDLKAAYAYARQQVSSKNEPIVLVQRHHPGNDNRFLILNGKCLGIMRRYHPVLVGDGRSTILDLIKAHNNRPDVAKNGTLGPMRIDGECKRMIARGGFTLQSVLKKGERLRVRSNANGAMGADSRDVTDEISPALVQLAEHIAVEAGLALAGVDLLVERPQAKTVQEAGAVVVEVNSRPALFPHHYPRAGTARPVAQEMVKAIAAAARNRVYSRRLIIPTIDSSIAAGPP